LRTRRSPNWATAPRSGCSSPEARHG